MYIFQLFLKLWPIGSASSWEHCICPLDCFVWLGRPSMQQRHKFFFPIKDPTILLASNKITLNSNQLYSAIFWRCPLCNGYHRRKWIRRHKFKSWTRLIAFHIALIPLGKVWNPIILPPAMGKIVGQTKFFILSEATSLGEGKVWIETC